MRASVLAVLVVCFLFTPSRDSRAQDQVRGQRDTTAFSEPPVSPWGAFFRSLVVPGWGQSALGAKSRGAFYFLAESASIVMLARTQIRLDHARRTLPPDDPLIASRVEQREDWIALVVFFALASAADGFVAAHLYGFEERTEELPVELALEFDGTYWVSLKIPVGP